MRRFADPLIFNSRKEYGSIRAIGKWVDLLKLIPLFMTTRNTRNGFFDARIHILSQK